MSRVRQWLAEDSLAIYLFHGVTAEARDGVRNYTDKHMDAAVFRSLVEELAAVGTPITADGMLGALRGSEPLPPRAFLISFDDGFLNNYTVAAPILEQLGVPAIFYVTTEFIEHNAASWIDMIEFALERTSQRKLRLPWSPEEVPCATRQERIAVLAEVRAVAKRGRDVDPYDLAASIMAAAAVATFEPDPILDEKMRWSQARDLHEHQLFRIGGHGHSHRILTHLDEPTLDHEITESLSILARELGGPVQHYSYPEGLAHCYSGAVIDRLRAGGVLASPTAEPGRNHVGDDLFRLKRILIA